MQFRCHNELCINKTFKKKRLGRDFLLTFRPQPCLPAWKITLRAQTPETQTDLREISVVANVK